MVRGSRIWLTAVALCVSAVSAPAQFNPQRQITVVVPIGAGGGVDATGRLFAEKLAERLKQPVVVENKVGAGGMVGTDYVAKAAPDGHTILVMENSAVLHKWLHKSVPFDVIADLTPVARVAAAPLVLIANPSFAPNSVRELIALAKGQPGKLSAGTPGIGTPHHLALLMLNALAKVEIVNVPYRGAALALNDLLAGQIPMMWAAPTAVMPHVAAGKAKVLGVASAKREPALPDIPTIAENGVPGFNLELFFGLAVPSKTPQEVVARLSKEIAEISAQPDVQERIRKVGLTPSYVDGEKFRAQLRDDHERFGKVIREAGIVPN
jgi:tripartite-type tricarboxylate transporter receptor subunit TctC